ncbi:extracellular solute-binding protein [Fibrobacter sp. UWEL]|uniref:extracellular solute-binding protein n=1 Tax=Fibrobacter sp. UWEL TaxID=1896209 RepID=UPI0009111DE4|nr:extracellular solute-binding protein [Fibrobacter sp. UWEL]SHK62035.1 multiple sugar transport system substrate-binding protein [Fibrobacter sp. UWEL]
MFNLLKKTTLAAVIAATAALAAPKPLTVWIMPNGASPQEKLEQRLEIFTKRTGIPTKVEVLDWGVAWSRISQALDGKLDAPDVLQLGTTWIPYFASRKEIKPLNGWLKDIQPERFVPVSWNTTHIDADTVIYSVPWFIDVRPLLANKRIFKKNGLTKESVSTYEGFREALKKINASDESLDDGLKVHAYAFPGKSDWNILHNFAPWVWSNGGSFLEKDSTGKWHSNILSKNTLKGIESYLKFILDSLVSTDFLQLNTSQVTQRFNNGELAFIVNTTDVVMQTRFDGAMGGLAEARLGQDSVMVLPFPRGSTGSVSFIGGSNLAIPSSCKRSEAKDLLLFLIEDENLDAYTKQIGLLPSSKKVLEAWSEDEDYKELVKSLETGRAYVSIPEWGELEQLLVNMFSNVWDHMEIPSLYSVDKLYEMFSQYSHEIDRRLNYQATDVMTLAEFKEIWSAEKKDINRNVSIDENDIKKAVVEDNLKKAPFVFIAIVILSFLINFARKRKK